MSEGRRRLAGRGALWCAGLGLTMLGGRSGGNVAAPLVWLGFGWLTTMAVFAVADALVRVVRVCGLALGHGATMMLRGRRAAPGGALKGRLESVEWNDGIGSS